ncbi:phage regulatory CII family protein [uncultured Novosphingobium sp.]|uniref:phage regulatory CII family protein n=1 Tax=uncultured Novosphingobium sp. TaxID=292277 RepID=UPI0025961FE4|nr:phage regulatory CII family protein [uncultured Novosphingobium sp.]
MTKPQKPLTHYRALRDVADHLGWDRCAAISDLSESMLRKMGDPETGREIKLRDAMRLEAVYRQDGGEGSPFFDCFAARLGVDTASTDAASCMIKASSKVAKEAGEAVAAALDAAGRGDHASKAAALKEAEEGLTAMVALVRSLRMEVAAP